MAQEITKQFIKEAVIEALEPFASSVASDFKKVNERLDNVELNLAEVKGDVKKVNERLDNVELNLAEVKSDVKWMKENSSAIFAKLDKYISLYEEQKQETLILNEHLRRLEERVSKLETEKR